MMDQQNMQGALQEDGEFDELDPNGLIGVIKIKDGLFICDELGAQVRNSYTACCNGSFRSKFQEEQSGQFISVMTTLLSFSRVLRGAYHLNCLYLLVGFGIRSR